MSDKLNRIRERIDLYDQELIHVFEKRMEAVLDVVSFKRDNNMPIFQKDREAQVLQKAVKNSQNPAFKDEIQHFFKEIMRISRRLQAKRLFPYNIVLIGFMGAGKSTIGEELSSLLEMEKLDTDDLIQTEMQMTINDIFKQYGEDFFRNKEEEIVQKVSVYENKIISCGGGVVLREANTSNLKKGGKIIFLETKAETIYSRIKADTTRPLLKDSMTKENIEKKLKQRDKYYRDAADFVVCTDQKTELQIAQEIITLLCRS